MSDMRVATACFLAIGADKRRRMIEGEHGLKEMKYSNVPMNQKFRTQKAKMVKQSEKCL